MVLKLKMFVLRGVLGIVVTSIVMLWLLITPGKIEQSSLTSIDVRASKALISSTLREFRGTDEGIEIILTQDEMDALFKVASDTLSPALMQGAIVDAGLFLRAVYPLSGYLNEYIVHAYCFFTQTKNGFELEYCKIGRLKIPGMLSRFIFDGSIKLLLDSPSDQQLLALIKKGKIQDGRIIFRHNQLEPIQFAINPLLYRGAKASLNIFDSNTDFAPDVEIYLAELDNLLQENPQEKRLAFYMQRLFILAIERAKGKNVETEYQNALWALAINFGNRTFARFAKSGLSPSTNPHTAASLLSGRQDLALHFLYSVVIKSVSNAQFATQIGNLKEISDAGKGGSGFSFVDLAADKAGIHFVQNLKSIDAQQVLLLNTAEFEMAFFPSVHDLPEGISEERFIEVLGGFNGDKAQEINEIIMNRLANLSLFQKQKQKEKLRPANNKFTATNLDPPTLTLTGDLHLHSRFSDGSQDIKWLATQAKNYGCDVIAITDHTDLNNKRFDDDKYIETIRLLQQQVAPLKILKGVEWNIPPFAGREHVSVIAPTDQLTGALLKEFRSRFDNQTRLASNTAEQAYAWLYSNIPGAVLFYNHPSRKDLSFNENLTDMRYWLERYDFVVGFEGGPGHQRKTGDKNGSYETFYRTVNGWDPAVAVIGGQWDKLLQQGYFVWGALATSDYHTSSMDYLPCEFSRTHIEVTDNSEQAIFDALKAGRFYASQGNFINNLNFNVLIDNEKMLFSGDQLSVNKNKDFVVSLRVMLNKRNFAGDPTWLDNIELIVIKEDSIETVPLYPLRNGDYYEVRWQGEMNSAFTIVRARGAMELLDGSKHYFYTNPIKLIGPK